MSKKPSISHQERYDNDIEYREKIKTYYREKYRKDKAYKEKTLAVAKKDTMKTKRVE